MLRFKNYEKNQVLFDNYDYDYEAIRKDILENRLEDARMCNDEEGKNLKLEDISDNDVFEEINTMEEMDWEYIEDIFKPYLDDVSLVATGTIGTWRGSMEGGIVVENYYDLCKLWDDCDYIKIYVEDGLLKIKSSHHDGTNYFTLNEITKKGDSWREAYYWDYDREKICRTLSTNKKYHRKTNINLLLYIRCA